jgi:putative ABC transport system permease protein
VIRLVWRGVRFARGRAVALAAGMLVAAVAFSLLTASVEVNAAQVRGVVGANWRGEYDLLVLPRGSVQTGAGKHLVQVNYLSASTSGITMAQYARIARLPGVQVAAPLEIVGYLLETASIPVVLSPAAVGRSGSRVLLVTSRYTADRGLSAYPPHDEGYVYITTDPVTPPSPTGTPHGPGTTTIVSGPTERLPDGKTVIVCPATFPAPSGQFSPFQRASGLDGDCYSRAGGTPGPVEGMVAWSFPVLVAGIDPRAESELTGLGRAVTSGKYLAEGQRPAESMTPIIPTDLVPVLASTASFDGDTDHVTVTMLPPSAVTVARSGASQAAMTRAFGSLAGTPVMQTTITGAAAWGRLLTELKQPAAGQLGSGPTAGVGQYWTSGPVTYRPGPAGRLDPVPVSNPVSIWMAGLGVGDRYVKAPPAAADTGYRALTEMTETYGEGKVIVGGPPQLQIRLTGEFDPERLAGFSGGGAGSPLASYRAPLLTGADAASRAALGNRPLEPDGNMAGYAQQPPLLYTTLSGAAVLENTAETYSEAGTRAAAQLRSTVAAPIGSIRVRVSGLRGTVPEKLDKIGAIGEEIKKATGLQVIITAGASPYPVTIGLPAGKFGRPALRLTENWTQTGAALLVLHQADRESLALLVLILVVCALFLSGAALAGVRGRRTEIGALRGHRLRRRRRDRADRRRGRVRTDAARAGDGGPGRRGRHRGHARGRDHRPVVHLGAAIGSGAGRRRLTGGPRAAPVLVHSRGARRGGHGERGLRHQHRGWCRRAQTLLAPCIAAMRERTLDRHLVAWGLGDRGDHAAQGRSEAPALVQGLQVRRVGRGMAQPPVHGRHRRVVGHPDHRYRRPQVVTGLDQLGPGAHREAAVPGVQRGEHGLDRAEHPDQRGRGLLPHAGDAGQPVARVAAQRRERGVGPAGDLVPGGDRGLVDHLELRHAAADVDDLHLPGVVDQLEQVPVPGHDLDGSVGPRGERADYVVCLVALRPGHRHPGGGQHLLDDRDLHGESVGHLLAAVGVGAVRLVGRDRRHPERRPPVRLHAGDQPLRPAGANQAGDHVEQPADGVHRSAVRSGHRLRYAVKRPEVHRGGVKQHQRAHPAILPVPADSRSRTAAPARFIGAGHLVARHSSSSSIGG